MKKHNYLIILSLWGILAACGGGSHEAHPENNAKVKVKISTVQLQSIGKQYVFTGAVQAYQQANISSRLSGKIVFLNVQEGEKVAQGQVLAQISASDIQAASGQIDAKLKEANAALQNAVVNQKRVQNLFDKNSATRKELDDINTQVAIVQAQIEAANQAKNEVQSNLGYATLTAPFTGYITRKMAEQGSLASPGVPILMMESANKYKVLANVPENEINLMQVGNVVSIEIEALNKKLNGKIEQINPQGGFNRAQFEVSIYLEADANLMNEIKSGMFARVLMEKGQNQNLMIPEKLVIRRGQLTGIYTVNQQQEVMLRWIRLGRKTGENVEVISGLKAGEKLITSFEGKIIDGAKAEII